jgi:hypothetical protein
MFTLQTPPLFSVLDQAERVLIAGAGGGFDVYAGLPLAIALTDAGKQVHLGSLTFSSLDHLELEDWVAPGLAHVTARSCGSEHYFPERTLARWMTSQDLPPQVYAFERSGVRPLRRSYQLLVDRLGIDAVVLVDGGTDILMRGDEAGLGTPEEDMASLVAAAGLDVSVKVVVCAGFGIDAHHGVCHAHVLENIAALDAGGSYLGAFSIPRTSRPGTLYLDAVDHAHLHTPRHPSIVNGQIAAAIAGEFGNVHFTTRTSGSELFINPLMALYFAFALDGVADRLLYRRHIEDTDTAFQIGLAIETFREGLDQRRPHQPIPH